MARASTMRSLASSSPWARYADSIAISTCVPLAVFAIASAPNRRSAWTSPRPCSVADSDPAHTSRPVRLAADAQQSAARRSGRQRIAVLAAGTIDGGVDNGPSRSAVDRGLPTPRLGDSINHAQASPPKVTGASHTDHGRLRAPISHLEPQPVIAVLHLDRAASSRVEHRVRHQFRQDQHGIVGRAAASLMSQRPTARRATLTIAKS